MPNCCMDGVKSFKCPEALIIRVDLMYCPFQEDLDRSYDYITEISSVIPEIPSWTVVATQTLAVQEAGSGLHEYYPVCSTYVEPNHC